MIELKNWQFHYRIDEEDGKVWQVNTMFKGKKKTPVESLMLFKGFGRLEEAFDYLAKTTGLPVWKLRKMGKKAAPGSTG